MKPVFLTFTLLFLIFNPAIQLFSQTKRTEQSSLEKILLKTFIDFKTEKNDNAKLLKLNLNPVELSEKRFQKGDYVFLSVAELGLALPGLNCFNFTPNRQKIIIFPGTSDVNGPDLSTADFDLWQDAAYHFAFDFNLTMYHRLADKELLPELEVSLEETRELYEIKPDKWKGISLKSKLRLQASAIEIETYRAENSRLAVKVDELQTKLDTFSRMDKTKGATKQRRQEP